MTPKKWWLLFGIVASVYVGLAVVPKVYAANNQRRHFFKSANHLALVLGMDKAGQLALSKDESAIHMIGPDGREKKKIPLAANAAFLDFTSDDLGFVTTTEEKIVVFDPASGKVLGSEFLLNSPLAPTAVGSAMAFTEGCGFSEANHEAWVQVGKKVEIWHIARAKRPTGSELKLPPLGTFAASRRAGFACYDEFGIGNVVRVKTSGSLAKTSPFDKVSIGESLAALAMDEDSAQFFALTESGKLYWVDKKPILIATLSRVASYLTPGLKVQSGTLVCHDQDVLITASIKNPKEVVRRRYPYIGGALCRDGRLWIGYRWSRKGVVDKIDI